MRILGHAESKQCWQAGILPNGTGRVVPDGRKVVWRREGGILGQREGRTGSGVDQGGGRIDGAKLCHILTLLLSQLMLHQAAQTSTS